ncbi:hypothetical protein ACFL5Z_13760 [Planctomycetota bacterium]
MNDNKIDVEKIESVIAIVKEDDKLRAVELRKKNGSYEILWIRSSEAADADWGLFATECDFSPGQIEQAGAEGGKKVIVGYNSAGTIFHRTTVPEVGEKEITSMVELQAESRLPLPAEQIELAWRTESLQGGEIGITMAVARKEQLQSFAASVRSIRPAKILLDCEGIVQAWKTFFSGAENKAVLLSLGTWNTQVCLVENGRLSNAVVLDVGMKDFLPEAAQEQTETSERFTQDMRSVLELFGCSERGELPIFVLSDGNALHVSIVSSLRMAQFNARVALPDVHTLKAEIDPDAEELYEYRAPIGLALMALEDSEKALDIFSGVYSPTKKKEQGHWLYSPKLAGALAVLMLLLLALVAYAVDVKSPEAIKKRVQASVSEMDMDLLVERQQLIRMVAQERPNMLDLLKLVNESGERGITLNGLQFKKGQVVTISGQAGSNDQLRDFEKSLQEKKGIEEVNCTPTMGSKGKKITFKMTFHYKNFTKKTVKRSSLRKP